MNVIKIIYISYKCYKFIFLHSLYFYIPYISLHNSQWHGKLTSEKIIKIKINIDKKRYNIYIYTI